MVKIYIRNGVAECRKGSQLKRVNLKACKPWGFRSLGPGPGTILDMDPEKDLHFTVDIYPWDGRLDPAFYDSLFKQAFLDLVSKPLPENDRVLLDHGASEISLHPYV